MNQRNLDATKRLSTARKHGATLTSPVLRGTRFALLVRPSADAGTVRVRLGDRTLGTYRLAKGKHARGPVVELGGFKHARRGKLKIEVVSSGKPVRINGVYAR